MRSFAVLAALLVLFGCATVPMASSKDDAAAKAFESLEGKANIYVYRTDTIVAHGIAAPISIDGKSVDIALGTYYAETVAPGRYTVTASGTTDEGWTTYGTLPYIVAGSEVLIVDAEPNENIFVAIGCKLTGIRQDQWTIAVVEEAAGKKEIARRRLVKSDLFPFLGCVIGGTPQEVQAAIDKGVDVNAAFDKKNGFTPLMVAATMNHHPEVITVLLKAGADAKMKDNEGRTALDYAKDNDALTGTAALKILEQASK